MRIPSPVIAAMPPPPPPPASAGSAWDSAEQEEVDEGYMYLPIRDRGTESAVAASRTAQDIDSEVCSTFGPDRHVFWPADAF